MQLAFIAAAIVQNEFQIEIRPHAFDWAQLFSSSLISACRFLGLRSLGRGPNDVQLHIETDHDATLQRNFIRLGNRLALGVTAQQVPALPLCLQVGTALFSVFHKG
jgi:hypothetical protein